MTNEVSHTDLAPALKEAISKIEQQKAEINRLQAKIDALMLEHCPDEMTPEQRTEWAKHQRPSVEPSAVRPPVKLEDYGLVIDEVAPVSKEAWDAVKSAERQCTDFWCKKRGAKLHTPAYCDDCPSQRTSDG